MSKRRKAEMESRLAAVLPLDAKRRVSPFVTSLMNRYARSRMEALPPEDYDEVYSEALLALVQSASRFDPKHKSKVKVTTLAFPRVRGQVIRATRTQLRRHLNAPTSLQSLQEDAGFDIAVPSHENRLIMRDQRTTILKSIAELIALVLNDKQEYTLIASFYQGISDVDIAAELACHVNVVRALKREAINILQRECRLRNITL